MKHVSLLLPHFVNLAGLENPKQGLFETNEFLKSKGKKPLFNVELVGIDTEVKLNNGQYSIRADKLIHDIEKTDIIIIPPIQNNIEDAISSNHRFYPWIREQHQKGTQVVSLCLGAFLLASTGLINGKKCVTHWRAREPFRKLFPDVKLLSDKILTDEDGIYTGGGAFSSANLILYLIEKLADREASIYCSKIFQIDAGLSLQSPFIVFKAQKNHEDKEILKAQNYIEKHYASKISVNQLCDYSGVGRRTFERRFKKATANTVMEYIQRIRIEVAKKGLERGQSTVNEVMYDAGYNDPKTFRSIFKKKTGITPLDYKKRFS